MSGFLTEYGNILQGLMEVKMQGLIDEDGYYREPEEKCAAQKRNCRICYPRKRIARS